MKFYIKLSKFILQRFDFLLAFLIERRSIIIVQKANMICPANNFYSVGMVNITMLAFISETFDNIRRTWPRITDDIWTRTLACDRKVKSQYRQEVVRDRHLSRAGEVTVWVLKRMWNTVVRKKINFFSDALTFGSEANFYHIPYVKTHTVRIC